MADKNLPWGLLNDKISPGSAKTISESKLKAFEVGTMNVGKKTLSKREQEELRKKQDEKATAEVYEEFVASFADAGKLNKSWVKGGVVNPEKNSTSKEKRNDRNQWAREDSSQPNKEKTPGKSKLYKPTSKLAELASTFQSVKEAKKQDEPEEQRPHVPGKKKKDGQKKSNLEIFKEELKQMQQEREQRHRMKKMRMGQPPDPGIPPPPVQEEEPPPRQSKFEPLPADFNIENLKLGPYDPADESTTNIYVGNINPKMTEQQLCEIFGRFGPLASVKIMWPRTDEERSRGRNCGFVAYMNRKDGERAMNTLKGKDIMQYEMKLGWGKAVPIPPHPVYIPPALVEMTQPPPPSGLPFNAQPTQTRPRPRKSYGKVPPPRDEDDPDKTLAKAVVKVVIPTERNLLSIIHRMIEFVVREGPMFEAMIMNRELKNPMFRFLFDNMSPAHTYYRWKLFSILQGDSPYKWRIEEFRMFKGGSLWKPPPMNPYTQGMPDELIKEENIEKVVEPEQPTGPKKGQLTDSQRDRLEDMLRELTPERNKVGDGMVWCLDHADSAEEIVECITESLSILQTPIPKKVARLFLVSDILFNSSAKVPNASFFRKCFQHKLKDIFKDVHEAYVSIDGRLKAEQFKQKVMSCFRAWEDWAIYPNDFLISLQNVFLGLLPSKAEDGEGHLSEADIDGAPIEDLDGAPLDTSKDIELKTLDGKPLVEDLDGDSYTEELDGAPLSEDLDGSVMEPEKEPSPPPQPKFASSKWETVDEAELEAQAMTTSKWDLLDQQEEEEEIETEPVKPPEEPEDIDGAPLEEEGAYSEEEDEYSKNSDSLKQEMTEERRAKLREIELKVMKYQDEVEMGKRSRKSHMSISQQVEHYRKKLLQKEVYDSPSSRERKRHRSRSYSPDSKPSSGSPRRSSSKRSKSPKRSRRSRSRSQHKRSSSRSPSRHRRKSKKSKHRD